jgi:hypothetical protein
MASVSNDGQARAMRPGPTLPSGESGTCVGWSDEPCSAAAGTTECLGRGPKIRRGRLQLIHGLPSEGRSAPSSSLALSEYSFENKSPLAVRVGLRGYRRALPFPSPMARQPS